MMRIRTILVLLVIVLLTAAFQNISPIPGTENPNAFVSFPPPVYTLRGDVEIRGTVNLTDIRRYYFEVRELGLDGTAQNESPFLPVTLPNTVAVVDDVLGVWDTSLVDDGLYELRMTVETTGGQSITSIVSPLRVENEIPPFLTLVAPTQQGSVIVVQTPIGQQPAPPTTGTTGGVVGTARVNGNVRTGDATTFTVIRALTPGETVEVIGISNTGSGWYYVRLADGRQGFAAPSILDITGDTSTLPRISPPPPPSPAAPTVAPTSVSTQPDALLTNVRFDRALQQGQPFQIFITVINAGGVSLPGVVVACTFALPVPQIFSVTSPSIAANSQTDVAITAQLDSGGGTTVTANCAADLNNLVVESNEGNNFASVNVAVAAP